MSHIVTVKDVKLTDQVALDAALSRLENAGKITRMGQGEHHLFAGEVQGEGVTLRGGKAANGQTSGEWNYPIVVDADGEIHYDNYGGRWGHQIALDELVQLYGVEAAKNTAELQGMLVTETLDEATGDILLTCSE